MAPRGCKKRIPLFKAPCAGGHTRPHGPPALSPNGGHSGAAPSAQPGQAMGRPRGARVRRARGGLGRVGSVGQGQSWEREGAGSPGPGAGTQRSPGVARSPPHVRPSPRPGPAAPRPATAGGVAVGTGRRYRDSGSSRGPGRHSSSEGKGSDI